MFVNEIKSYDAFQIMKDGSLTIKITFEDYEDKSIKTIDIDYKNMRFRLEKKNNFKYHCYVDDVLKHEMYIEINDNPKNNFVYDENNKLTESGWFYYKKIFKNYEFKFGKNKLNLIYDRSSNRRKIIVEDVNGTKFEKEIPKIKYTIENEKYKINFDFINDYPKDKIIKSVKVKLDYIDVSVRRSDHGYYELIINNEIKHNIRMKYHEKVDNKTICRWIKNCNENVILCRLDKRKWFRGNKNNDGDITSLMFGDTKVSVTESYNNMCYVYVYDDENNTTKYSYLV